MSRSPVGIVATGAMVDCGEPRLCGRSTDFNSWFALFVR